MEHRLIICALSALFALALTGCGEEETPICQHDEDCPDGQQCIDQMCEEPDDGDFGVDEQNGDDDCPDDGCHPRLFVPHTVEFFNTAPNRDYTEIATIENYGEEPLEIHDISLQGDDAFDLSFPGKRPDDGDIPPPEDDDDTFTGATLAPDEALVLRVWFHTEVPQPQDGEILVDTNAVDADTASIELKGNHETQCLVTLPRQQVDFGPVPVGETARRTVQLRNCSRARQLEIFGISVSGDEDGAFHIPSDAYPGDLPGGSLVLAPKEERLVTLETTPSTEDVTSAELVVSSSDERQSERRVELTAEGTDTSCPTANIDEIDTSDAPLEVAPHQPIQLSAAGSHADDAEIAAYEWTVVSAPLASHPYPDDLVFTPSDSAPDPTFTPDVAGTYLLELTVVDDQGVSSCQPAQLEVHARPASDVYIQAAWHNLYTDDTEQYEGTDINLHYVHPDGDWNSADWSVFFDQPQQDWNDGLASMVSDNNWGEFPEAITHQTPVDGHRYDVGVHYNWDFGLGPSDVTLSVYLEGELVWETLDRRIYDVDDLWHVGYVDWSDDDAEFVEIDELVSDHSIPSEEPEFF